jgi:thioredoxin reductase
MASIDVAIIGGGPAGLTAAATLARQLHTVVVFDGGHYRNDGTYHVHTVPGWDHKHPQDFRQTSRKQIEENYDTVQFVDVTVTSVEKKGDSSFHITDDTGSQEGASDDWIQRCTPGCQGIRGVVEKEDVSPGPEMFSGCMC